MYSSVDILEARKKGDIYIFPYEDKNLQGASYNVTASLFALSAKKGLLFRVYESKGDKYIDIEADDTALILTREYIKINSASIAGTIHSKVRLVCDGYGHVCATSDPWWQGSLLMAINNPSSQKRKFKIYDSDKGFTSIATIVFYDLKTPTNIRHDNLPARHDILKDYVGKSANLRNRLIFNKQFLLLDEIISIITGDVESNYIRRESYPLLNLTKNQLAELNSIIREQPTEKAIIKTSEIRNQLSFYDYSEKLHEDIITICNYISTDLSNQTTVYCQKEIERLLKLCDLEFEGLRWNSHLKEIEDKISDYSKSTSVLFWILKWVNLHNILLVVSLLALCTVIVIQVFFSESPFTYTGNLIGIFGSMFVVLLATIKKS